MTISKDMISKPTLLISTISLVVILILGIGSQSNLLNPVQQQIVHGQEEGTSDTSTGDVASSGCHPSTEACTPSDLLLNDDDTVLCDPSLGDDCSQYLNQPMTTSSEGCDPTIASCPPEEEMTTGGAEQNTTTTNETLQQGCDPTIASCPPEEEMTTGGAEQNTTTTNETLQQGCDPTIASCPPE